MHLKLKFAGFVAGMAAAILLTGCPNTKTSYTYTGPPLLFGAGGTAPSCPSCFISGTFTLNAPLGCGGSGSSLSTYPDLRALTNGKLMSFDFTISNWTLGGTAPRWSSTNGAITDQFGVSLDSSCNLGNWNIEISSNDRSNYFATCNATAGFKTEFPAPPAIEAGFPSGAACITPAPTKDTFSGGGNTLFTGNGPGVMQ